MLGCDERDDPRDSLYAGVSVASAAWSVFLMRTFVSTTFALLCFLSANVTGVDAQTGEYPPIAAFGADGNIWLYGFEAEPIQVTDDTVNFVNMLWHPGGPLHNMVWSPDGTLLAYVAYDGSLHVFNIGDQSTIDLGVWSGNFAPITFSRDGEHLLYVRRDDPLYDRDFIRYYEVNLYQIAVEAGPVPEQLASLGEADDVYGGGPISPAELAYRGEMGGLWRFGDRILVETPFGVLSSSDNANPDGIKLYNAGDGAGVGTEPILNAVISPDRTQLGTIRNEKISLIDLATQEEFVLETEYAPHIISWGVNDDIFYTSVNYGTDFKDEMTDEEREILLEQNDYILDMGFLTSDNIVSIHSIDISSGSEDTIYQTEAYAIGRLMPAPNGREIFFSTIPNIDTWLDMILSGEIEGCDFDCQLQLFQPSLYRLDLATGDVELIGTGLYKATINFPGYERMNQ